MKQRWFSALLCVLFLMGLVSTAMATDSSTEVVTLSDGSYIVSVISDVEDGISTAGYTITKAKTSTYYSSDDVAQWYVRVVGTFTYDNTTSKCIASAVGTHVYASGWKMSDATHSISGNKASATATAKYYVLWTVQNTITKTVTLTCSATGQLS